MREKINQNSFKGQAIYVGIDVHLKDWKVSVMSEDIHYKTFSSPPTTAALSKYLFEHFPGAIYHTAYEAGFSGFWLHRELTKLGIKSIVVNPADIPTTDKERTQKEDKRDSRKIAKTLRAGQLKPIYVPSEKIQYDRILMRTRDRIVRDLARNKVRIKSMIYFLGINYPDRFKSRRLYWSQPLITWLESIQFEHKTGHAGLSALLEMVKHQRMLLLKIERQMRELAKTSDYKTNVDLLIGVPGVGTLTAMKFLTELETLDRFENFNQLASFIGLVPSTNSSGDNHIDTGITPRGNLVLRSALVESSWIAIRNDPALLSSFQALTRRMKGAQAIVRIAKKLLRRMVHVLTRREHYEKSIVK